MTEIKSEGPMSPLEIQDALIAFRAEVGENCQAHLQVDGTSNNKPIHGYCRPRGWDDDSYIIVWGDTWQGVLDSLRAKWSEMSADIRKNTVRNMALAIIRITADTGSCTDAALRADKFSKSDILNCGVDACRMADGMASNGPFQITALQGANAA